MSGRSCAAPTNAHISDAAGGGCHAPAAATINSCSPSRVHMLVPGPLIHGMGAIAGSADTRQYAKLRRLELLAPVLGWSFTSEQSRGAAILLRVLRAS